MFLSLFLEISIVILVLALLLVISCLRRVPEGENWITESFGVYRRTLQSGLFLLPLGIEKIVHKVYVDNQNHELFIKGLHSKDNQRLDFKINFTSNVYDAKRFAYSNVNWEELLTTSIEVVSNHYTRSTILEDRSLFTNDAFEYLQDKCIVLGISMVSINFYIE